MAPQEVHMRLPILAFALCLLISAAMIIVVFIPVNLTEFGTYSSSQHAVYITLATILATLLTAFISAQIQRSFLLKLDWDLNRPAVRGDYGMLVLDERWRSILRIGNAGERIRNYPVGLSYVFVSLITTAIVASFSPTQSTRTFPYYPKIPSGPQSCAMVRPHLPTNLSHIDYSWDLGNGSSFFVPAGAAGCPPRQAVKLASMINTIDPPHFAYANTGVAIRPSAMGAPFTFYYPAKIISEELTDALHKYGDSAVNTTQCVPVMTKNPISCRPGGKVEVRHMQLEVTSDDGLCTHTVIFDQVNPVNGSAMAKKMCTHGEVGQGTMILGATGTYAKWLAVSIGDAHRNSLDGSNSSYAVSCTVDTRDVLEFRNVVLRLQNSGKVFSPGYARVLEGGATCKPPNNTIDNAYFGISAAANWQLLSQNDGSTGWFDTIDQATDTPLPNYLGTNGHGNGRGPPYAFENSNSALEDVFGLVSALVISRINATERMTVDGTISVVGTRVGSGKAASIGYAIPSLLAAGVLLWQILSTWDIRGIRYSAGRMTDLMDLGEMSAKEGGFLGPGYI